MDIRTFDTLTLHAGSRVSRRSTLLTLGLVGVGAITAPTATEAKRKRRKKQQSVGEKAAQKCQQQVGQCVAFLGPTCDGDLTCQARVQRCCTVVGECDIVGLFTCASMA